MDQWEYENFAITGTEDEKHVISSIIKRYSLNNIVLHIVIFIWVILVASFIFFQSQFYDAHQIVSHQQKEDQSGFLNNRHPQENQIDQVKK